MTFTVAVLPVNNAPSFNLSTAIVTLDEGSVVRAIPEFAFVVSKGSPTGNEDNQNVSFIVWLTDGDRDIFAADGLPQIEVDSASNCTLRFELAPFMNGNVTFNVSLHDDGGTERGGSDTSENMTFTVAVLPVNQAPSFNLSTKTITAYESGGPYSIQSVVDGIRSGRANEDYQSLSFRIVQKSCHLCVAGLFTAGPELIISGIQGDLVFTVAMYEYGNAAFDVILEDNGGTEREGVNASAPQLLTINVLPLNNPPVFNIASDKIFIDETSTPGNSITLASFAYAVNAGSPIGNEDEQEMTFLVSHVETTGPAFFETPPAIILANATGNLTFTLLPFAYGNISFVILLLDDGPQPNNTAQKLIEFVIYPVNQPPAFEIMHPLVSILECGHEEESCPEHFVASFVTMTTKGPSVGNEDEQNLTFLIIESGPAQNGIALGPEIIQIERNGTLKFSASRFYNGNITLDIWLEDDGGTDRNGNNKSNVTSFVIQVVAVNQPPLFHIQHSVSVLESSLGQINDFADSQKQTSDDTIGTEDPNITGATDEPPEDEEEDPEAE